MLTGERPPPLQVVAEVARLAAVRSYHVLDLHIPALDSFAEMAAHCMSRPMGAVSFVDSDRVWFSASFGFTKRELHREGSFCHQTITSPGPLVIRDALYDERFYGGEPGQPRFYAGAVLEDDDGYRLGTVCVFDPSPGEADPGALLALSRVAAMAMGALTAYRETLPGFAQIFRPGPVGIQGWLGVRTKSSARYHANSRPGLLVISVAADSPAERAGIRVTDVLIRIDGRVLRHSSDVVAALGNRPPESHARVQLLRGGQTLERLITIEPERHAKQLARPLRAMAG